MARHYYDIPLQKAQNFLKKHRGELEAILRVPKALSYHALMGRGHYTLQIERLVRFFKIDREIDYALKTAEFFHGREFMAEMAKRLGFGRFRSVRSNLDTKSLFYAFCHLYALEDPDTFALFVEKSFIHDHAPFNRATDVRIDYREMSRVLANSRGLSVRESFGEEGEEAYFRLYLGAEPLVELRGKSIKTLRKKAYRQLFRLLLEENR